MSKTPKKRAAPKQGNGAQRRAGGSGEDGGAAGAAGAPEARRSRGRNAGKDRAATWFRSVEVALWLMVVGAVLFRFVPGTGHVSEEGTAPDFTVRTLSGDKVTLSDLRGDVVLVNFWATWCPPCRLEIPGFQRVYDDYKDKGFTVVGLSTDEQGPGIVRRFVTDKGITYPIGMATDDMRRLYGGVDALPQSFLLDKTGHVRKMVAGMFSEGILRREVDALLAEGQAQ